MTRKTNPGVCRGIGQWPGRRRNKRLVSEAATAA